MSCRLRAIRLCGPVARRRVHDGDHQFGVGGGVAVAEHAVDLAAD
jgi:hypothetical protein